MEYSFNNTDCLYRIYTVSGVERQVKHITIFKIILKFKELNIRQNFKINMVKLKRPIKEHYFILTKIVAEKSLEYFTFS